jgi:hypothetical protein
MIRNHIMKLFYEWCIKLSETLTNQSVSNLMIFKPCGRI